MKARPTKTGLRAERLRELVRYEPETGLFFNLVKRATVPVGLMSNVLNHGYQRFYIDGIVYQAHRLAWLYMTGEWPKNDIDHMNGVRSDNRWSNLRDVPRKINCENLRPAQSNNRLGFMGVKKYKKKYVANLYDNYKQIHLGTFCTPEEAHQAYIEAKRRLHKGCTI